MASSATRPLHRTPLLLALPLLLLAALLVNPAIWQATGRTLGDGFLSELDRSRCLHPDPVDVDNHPEAQPEDVPWWCYGLPADTSVGARWSAQAQPAAAAVSAEVDAAPPAEPPAPPPRQVRSVFVPSTNLPGIPDAWERHPLHPNALLVVQVDALDAWIDEHPDDRCEVAVRLVINGHTLNGLQPTLCDGQDGVVLFQLHNLDLFDDDMQVGQEEGWRLLLDSRAHLTWTIAQVSLAWAEEKPLPTLVRGKHAATLVLISPASAILSISGAILSLLLLWTFGTSSTLLRVTGSTADKPGPWSLRRVQAAWWFLVIFTAWEILAAFTRDIPPIGITSLLLLGIAGGTYSAELVIPAIQDDVHADVPSRGFLGDLVSDARGPVLHRVQMVIWSLVLGLAFIYLTIAKLRMPELDETLLGLMGLSAAGYLSGKTKEARHPAGEEPPPP